MHSQGATDATQGKAISKNQWFLYVVQRHREKCLSKKCNKKI